MGQTGKRGSVARETSRGGPCVCQGPGQLILSRARPKGGGEEAPGPGRNPLYASLDFPCGQAWKEGRDAVRPLSPLSGLAQVTVGRQQGNPMFYTSDAPRAKSTWPK